MSEDNMMNEGLTGDEYNILVLRNDNIDLRAQIARQSEMISMLAAESMSNTKTINDLREKLNQNERSALLAESKKQTKALDNIAEQLTLLAMRPLAQPAPLGGPWPHNPNMPYGPYYVSSTTQRVEPQPKKPTPNHPPKNHERT